jgi:hypothetical protein
MVWDGFCSDLVVVFDGGFFVIVHFFPPFAMASPSPFISVR